MKKAIAIVDLQFGSTGKGLLAGTLAHALSPDTCVHANHPNAGHTFAKGDSRWVYTMTANSFVAPSVKTMLIGPGAVVDLAKLRAELDDPVLADKSVVIHPNAVILTQAHREAEAALLGIGSTMKGSSQAVMAKMRRSITDSTVAGQMVPEIIEDTATLPCGVFVDRDMYDAAVVRSELMIVEGAQGHSLSIHGRFYPFCTSRDVSVNQLFADCGLPRIDKIPEVIVGGTLRTFPIRVANRFDKHGKQVGTSGAYYPDQRELDWRMDMHREPELTTVTKLPRRIFSFSFRQLHEACQVNRPDFLFLSFCDYLANDPGDNVDIPAIVNDLRRRIMGVALVPARMLSYGPRMEDVHVAVNGRQDMIGPDVFELVGW